MQNPDSAKGGRDGDLSRSRAVSRVAVVSALIVALVAGLMLFDHDSVTIPGGEYQAPVLASESPKIGASISTRPEPDGVQSGALKQEIAAAPAAAHAEIESLAPPSNELVSGVGVVPEGTESVVLTSVATEPVVPKTGRALIKNSGSDSEHDLPQSDTHRKNQPKAIEPDADHGAYVLQLGVFSNLNNVEDLQGKLKQAGIVAKLETRVQIGPFANKDEALKAQLRLRKLGLGDGMLISAPKRP